jgi:hypothetical protein
VPLVLPIFPVSRVCVSVRLRDAEVGDLEHAVAGHEHVGRLQIVVRDLGDLVGVAERRAELRDERREVRGGDAAAGGVGLDFCEALALDVFHRDRGARLLLDEIVNAYNVGVRQLKAAARLQLQVAHRLGIRRDLRREKFQRDRPIELLVAGAPHHAHAAAADLGLEGVARKHLLAGGESRARRRTLRLRALGGGVFFGHDGKLVKLSRAIQARPGRKLRSRAAKHPPGARPAGVSARRRSWDGCRLMPGAPPPCRPAR